MCLVMHLCTRISFTLSVMILITGFILRLLMDLSADCWGAKNIIYCWDQIKAGREGSEIKSQLE